MISDQQPLLMQDAGIFASCKSLPDSQAELLLTLVIAKGHFSLPDCVGLQSWHLSRVGVLPKIELAS